jgi:hypothetical protein
MLLLQANAREYSCRQSNFDPHELFPTIPPIIALLAVDVFGPEE